MGYKRVHIKISLSGLLLYNVLLFNFNFIMSFDHLWIHLITLFNKIFLFLLQVIIWLADWAHYIGQELFNRFGITAHIVENQYTEKFPIFLETNRIIKR